MVDFNDKNDITFGEKLRAIRKARGISQHELADMTNIAQCQISWYEHDRCSPSIFTLGILCKALNVSSKTLLGF
jgi:transcriptional regulator with XRE-family HTH domain